MVTIIQLFFEMDMRKGDIALNEFLAELRRSKRIKKDDMPVGEEIPDLHVYVFINRKLEVMKVLASHGLFIFRLPSGQTFDLGIRRNQIFNMIGSCFGLKFNLPEDIFNKAQKELNTIRKIQGG